MKFSRLQALKHDELRSFKNLKALQPSVSLQKTHSASSTIKNAFIIWKIKNDQQNGISI